MPDLFESARAGNRAAETEIHRRIRAFARAICSGRPAGGSDADWEDVAQEAARKLFASGLDRYQGKGSVDSYLYTIVKTTVIQLARGAKRRRLREESFETTTVVVPNPSGRRFEVREILRRLPEGCRELVVRVFLDGAGYRDLARESGLAESSVRARLSRCMQKAREIAGARVAE